ncbi:MAG: 2-oxo acid dehydrogenase subunit E2 [Bacteroidetes bacterium]|nr:2-oxo acid dehydrogenase subunit E2 [Bacteroidota bacterium]
MQVAVLMPKMGESITEGKIVKWHKKTGEKIDRDEVLLEISTDKVDTEIPSSTSGILSKMLVQEQEVAEVGAVIAYIETGTGQGAAVVEERPKPEDEEMQIPHAESMSSREPVTEKSYAAAPSHGHSGDKFYSPLVKSIAKAEGISLDELTYLEGTGAGGRVTKEDVIRYIENRTASQARARKEISSQQAAPQVKHDSAGEQVIPMDNMRQRIMEHMVASRDVSVHVAAITEVDMTGIADYISRNGEAFRKREGFQLTFMPFISHAAIKALKDFPLVNSSIQGTNILQHNYVNLGIAVAVETTGLLVPVIRRAEEKNVLGLARAIKDLATRARTKRLTGDDTIGSTFSITNYGVFGNLMGTPIINQPNVAILGVGAVKKRPVVINDAIAIRQMGFLTLSFDHRLVDGALGGQFLERIVHYLENFDTKQVS